VQHIEYFYSAHSAFAYLGSVRLMDIAKATGRQLFHKPMNLGEVVATAYPEGFRTRSAAHRAYYFGREIERWAEHRNVPFKGGVPANHGNDITLANSILIAGLLQEENVDQLAHAFMQAHWENHADLSDKQTLVSLIEGAGFDPASLIEAAKGTDVKEAYKSNTAEAIERSVFGSPTYFIDGDMFYGQDHLELVERALQKPFAKTWPT
jgi:2-hydroxychromene-2-carboxylate isomerase